jgi:hypothetical protein
MLKNKANTEIASRIILITFSAGFALLTRYSPLMPGFLRTYGGDTFWATAFFFAFSAIFRKIPLWSIGVITAFWALGIEISQLYQAPWINALRATRIGGWILGYGFLWSDLACYGVGIGIGYGLAKIQFKLMLFKNSRISVTAP